ncbi:MAG: hypothetical protein KGS61_14000 [Verrucomicrobia bacterium]|nr:hypothetical protein [Verrucomicrobiota bacterium]
MKVIQPNCRVQFTAEDVAFILSALRAGAGQARALVELLTEENSRDLILDDEALYRALLEQRGCLPVSARLYFYVLVRRVLREAGIEDRAVADYVAELLAEFSRTERLRGGVPGSGTALDYFVDLLAALGAADERAGFVIHAHIGNYSLFLAGIFPERLRFRAEIRGSPDLRYYERLGQASFRVASDHRLARKYQLTRIFTTLAERFQAARLALNDLSNRILSLGDADYSPLLAGERGSLG